VAELIRNRPRFAWPTIAIGPGYQQPESAIDLIKETINSGVIPSERKKVVEALQEQGLEDLVDAELNLSETARIAEQFLLGSPVIAPLGR
jgi:hypothetical protein